MAQQKTIAIIGGGITGLAAAYRAQSLFPSAEIVLLESSDRLGGVLQSEKVDGFTIERSADMFVSDPAFAMDLVAELGRTDDLLQTKPADDKAFVATADSIHSVPSGLSLMLPSDLEAVLNSPLLDDDAKKRFLKERDVPTSDSNEDESLRSFATRRFGQSVFEQLIQPLISGIYTADPNKLSMKATMAKFVAMEKEYGSLIAAAEHKNKSSESSDRNASGARYGLFRAPKNGIGELINWTANALNRVDIRTNCDVTSVEKSGSSWTIKLQQNEASKTIDANAVVFATAARVAGSILKTVDEPLAFELQKIQAASSAIVILGIEASQIERPFSGYGIIVPSALNRKVIATSFSSNKFAGRAPDGKLLIRTFIGGALQSELVDLPDDELVKIATDELNQTVGFSGAPELTRVYRWRNCMPQYHLGHFELVERIETLTAKHSGLQLAGNSYRGVGIPACIQSGYEAIDRLASELTDS